LSFIAGQCIEYQHIDVMKEKKMWKLPIGKIVIIIKRQQKRHIWEEKVHWRKYERQTRRRGKDMFNDEIPD